MSKVVKISNSDHNFVFKCPGCNMYHRFSTGGDKAIWDFNGDMEKPTLHPSYKTWWDNHICHSWVKNGMIEFCPDSTHYLSGQTVELLECDI